MEAEILERIGLTKSEAKVYLSLLKIGQSTAGPIVDDAGVTRSKIYDILQRLQHKGLVSVVMRSSTKYFSAADPASILTYLQSEEDRIKREKEMMERALPELLLQQSMATHGKLAEIFIGFKGLENAFNTIIGEFDAKERFYALGAGIGETAEQVQRFFLRVHHQRVKRRVRSRIIFNEQTRGAFKEQEQSPLVEARYLHQTTPAAINIYRNYTLIAILTKEPVALLIRSPEAADSFRAHFASLWKIANR